VIKTNMLPIKAVILPIFWVELRLIEPLLGSFAIPWYQKVRATGQAGFDRYPVRAGSHWIGCTQLGISRSDSHGRCLMATKFS